MNNPVRQISLYDRNLFKGSLIKVTMNPSTPKVEIGQTVEIHVRKSDAYFHGIVTAVSKISNAYMVEVL